MNRIVFGVLFVSALFAFVSADIKKEGDKITIRTKRQQCVCVVVSQSNQQLQCSCDSNQTGGGGNNNTPIPTPPPFFTTTTTTTPMPWTTTTPFRGGFFTTTTSPPSFDSSNNPCACVQIMVSKGTSQYACDCNAPQRDTTGTPSSNFMAQDQGSGQNFLQSAITQADYFGSNSNNNFNNGNNNQQQQSFQPQQPMTNFQTTPGYLNNNNNNNQNQFQPMQQNTQQQQFQDTSNQNQNFLNTALTHSNFLGGNNNMNQQQPMQQQPQQQQQQFGTPSMFQQDAPQQQQPFFSDSEPATTTCITVTIPANGQSCMCGNNYVQCADNMCCHKRYRSLKKDEESAMDIIVDVLRNIKDRLDRP